MTLKDNNSKIMFIGIEHLNITTSRKVMYDNISVYDITLKDVAKGVRKHFLETFRSRKYSLVLFANNRNKVLIYNAK